MKPFFFFFFLMIILSPFLVDSTIFIDGVSADPHSHVSVLSTPRTAGGFGGITVLPQVTVDGDRSPKKNIRTRNAAAAASSSSNSTRVLQEDPGLGGNEGTGFDGVCYTEVPYDAKRHQQVYTVGVLAIRGFESAYNDFNKSKEFLENSYLSTRRAEVLSFVADSCIWCSSI